MMEMLHLPLPLVSLHNRPMKKGHSCHPGESESVSDEDDDDDDGDDDEDVYSNDWIYFHRVLRVNCYSHLLSDLKVMPLTLVSYPVDLIDRHLMLYPLRKQVTLR